MFKPLNQAWMRVLIALFIVFSITGLTATSASAAGVDDDGIIEEDEIIYDDVVLAADTIRVDGTVEGNVFASGYSVTINGRITGDAFLFGNEIILGENAVIEGNLFGGAQTIRIAGDVSGSLAAGSSVLIMEAGAAVMRNLYYGGYSLEIEPESMIGVDVFSGNYQLVMDGSIGRDLNIGGAAVEINGSVKRNVNIDLDTVQGSPIYFPMPAGVSETLQPGLRVGEMAQIGGDLKYTTQIDQGGKILAEPEGKVIFQTPVPEQALEAQEKGRETRDGAFWVFGRFALGILKKFWENFISLLVVGTVVVLLLPGLFKRTVGELRKEPLPSAGFGLLSVILGYIALFLAALAILAVGILLSFLSAGGLGTATFGFGFASLGFVGTVFTMLILYVSKIIVAYIAGHWILSKIAPESKAADSLFWGMALGVLIYSILRIIPIFGWLMAFIVIILGMGAIWLTYRNWQRPASPAVLDEPASPEPEVPAAG